MAYCENVSFLDRARGAFDGVLMLAMLHHLLVTERIPLPEVRDLAFELTSDLLVIEFVAPQDPMFLRLTRGRESLYQGLDRTAFEACFHPISSCQSGAFRGNLPMALCPPEAPLTDRPSDTSAGIRRG